MYQSSYTGAEIDAGVRPYKVYTALLNQATDEAPIATVLENTLSAAIVWTRAGVGSYEGTLANEFVDAKTVAVVLNEQMLGLSSGAGSAQFYRSSVNAVGLLTYSDRFTTPADALLENFPVEIRVYP